MEQNAKLHNFLNLNTNDIFPFSKYEHINRSCLQSIPYQMYDYSNYKLKRIIEHGNYLDKLKRIKSKNQKNSKLKNIIKQVCSKEDNSKNEFYSNESSPHCNFKVDDKRHHLQNQHKLDIKNVHLEIEKFNDKIYNTKIPFLNQDINDKRIKKIREFSNILNDLYYLNKDEHKLEDIQKYNQKCHENTNKKNEDKKTFYRGDHKNKNEKVDSTLNNLEEQYTKGSFNTYSRNKEKTRTTSDFYKKHILYHKNDRLQRVVHSKIQLNNKLVANAFVSKESKEQNNNLDNVIFHVYETRKNKSSIEKNDINKLKNFPNLSTKSINHSNIVQQDKIDSTLIFKNSSKFLLNDDDACDEINSKNNEIKSCIDNIESNMVVNSKSSKFKSNNEFVDGKPNTIIMKDLDHFSMVVAMLDAKSKLRYKKKINVEKSTSNENPLVTIDNRYFKLYNNEKNYSNPNNGNNYNKEKIKNVIDTNVSLIFKGNVFDPCQIMEDTKIKNSMENCNDGLRKYSQLTLRDENDSLFTKYPILQSCSKLLSKNLTDENNPNQIQIFTPKILNSMNDSTSMKNNEIVQGSIDHFKDNLSTNQSDDYKNLFVLKEFNNATNCACSSSNVIENEMPNTKKILHWAYENDNTIQNLSTLKEQFSSTNNREPQASLNLSPNSQGYINNESNHSPQIDSILSISSDIPSKERLNINNFSLKVPLLEKPFKNDVYKIANESISDRNVGSLKQQNLIEIVVEQPFVEHIDESCEATINKNSNILKNSTFLYNDFLNNSQCTSKNNFDTLDQIENRKCNLQTHVFDKNVKDDINNFSPNSLEIIIESPRSEEAHKTKSWIQDNQIQNYTNKFSKKCKKKSKIIKYAKKKKVGRKIQTNLSSSPKDERIFSKLNGYVCLEDDEILL